MCQKRTFLRRTTFHNEDVTVQNICATNKTGNHLYKTKFIGDTKRNRKQTNNKRF